MDRRSEGWSGRCGARERRPRPRVTRAKGLFRAFCDEPLHERDEADAEKQEDRMRK
jgi:hypothetical protein